jgi:PPOX class probable F420-dependent enzyme
VVVPAKGRDLVKMTETEIAELLAASKKVQVATVNPDGSPHLTTLFYVVQDGQIAFWTYGRSQKIRNLERDPRITCLVETGDDYFELRGVSVTGTARLVTDEPGIREIGAAVASRMVDGADLGDIGRNEVERQVRKRVGVVVVPSRTASWDHRKMLAATES